MQDCFYTVNNKRVTGIVPALETHHDIRILGKEGIVPTGRKKIKRETITP